MIDEILKTMKKEINLNVSHCTDYWRNHYTQSDDVAINGLGLSTPRIAGLMKTDIGKVRRKLYQMEEQGLVIMSKKEWASVIIWWPTGFCDDLKTTTGDEI